MTGFFAQILKTAVDRCTKEKDLQSIPYCRMGIKWRGEPIQTFPCISRHVELDGAKSPDNYFNIYLPESLAPSLSGSGANRRSYQPLQCPFTNIFVMYAWVAEQGMIYHSRRTIGRESAINCFVAVCANKNAIHTPQKFKSLRDYSLYHVHSWTFKFFQKCTVLFISDICNHLHANQKRLHSTIFAYEVKW